MSKLKFITLILAISLNTVSNAANAQESRYERIGIFDFPGECKNPDNCLVSSELSVTLFLDKEHEQEGRQTAVLLKDYFYCHDASGEVYMVPSGFRTDWASIPSVAEIVIRSRDFMAAAVIHDWLYAVGEPNKRKHADKVFHDILKETGASFLTRRAMYRGVRIGGNSAYGKGSEWRLLDLETYKPEINSSIQRPDKASIATIDCNDEVAYNELKNNTSSKRQYKVKRNSLGEDIGFVRVSN